MPLVYDKGFHATLFDCVNEELISVLGRDSVLTFYYLIRKRVNLREEEFAQKPIEVLEGLRSVLGEHGFRVVERGLLSNIKRSFSIKEDCVTLRQSIELARRNYLRKSV